MFDITFLFIMVSLDFTINLVLKMIYDRKERQTKISKNEMKGLLLLCTKIIHFTFENNLYQQKDRTVMESSLSPLLVGIFMVELKKDLIPKLSEYMTT